LVVGLAAAAACTGRHATDGARASDPLAAGLIALAAGRPDAAAHRFEAAARRHPAVADLALYLRARAMAASGRNDAAVRLVEALLASRPDSAWAGPARLLAGEVRRRTADLSEAQRWFESAAAAFPAGSPRWLRATLALAEVEHARGADRAALDLANAVRRRAPRTPAGRRARRLADRIQASAPELLATDPATQIAEAELRLRENDARGAAAEADAALPATGDSALRARALWVRAQADHALGRAEAAEATCRALADLDAELGARALAAAGTWRWNADDDRGALALFEEVTRRWPESLQAPDCVYAVGRIYQEAGRFDDAARTFTSLATRYPSSPLAPEARWRAAWAQYLAGDFPAAAAAFAAADGEPTDDQGLAAAYWRARALEQLGDPAAAALLEALADEHPATYYGRLARERLGRLSDALAPADLRAPPAPFPPDLAGEYADGARTLIGLGFYGFAREELDALRARGGADARLVAAYAAARAPDAAARLAVALGPHPDLERYAYPLAYWETVRREAGRAGVDPLLVLALMRQESFFDPAAVSPADAHGLMQLAPRTARETAAAAGRAPPSIAALHQPATAIALGTLHLRALLDRYSGSWPKALAAYNAGVDAVAKWEQRYGTRPEDELVELVSFRETRDYVKRVLRNYEVYRRLYAPSPAATSAGSPPKAPFDMMTMTSPGRADATR
jgi:soluble lytic murein transglycosylase